MQTVVEYTCLGMWLSWLARFAHIEEVGGFESLHPHQTQRHPAGASVFGYVYGTRSRGKRGCCISPQNKGLLYLPQNNTGQLTMCCPGFCIYLICSKTDRQRCSGTMKTNKNKSQ